ncbi:hypothetical protein LXL04_023512 [Taraxacum kok-saghyz]
MSSMGVPVTTAEPATVAMVAAGGGLCYLSLLCFYIRCKFVKCCMNRIKKPSRGFCFFSFLSSIPSITTLSAAALDIFPATRSPAPPPATCCHTPSSGDSNNSEHQSSNESSSFFSGGLHSRVLPAGAAYTAGLLLILGGSTLLHSLEQPWFTGLGHSGQFFFPSFYSRLLKPTCMFFGLFWTSPASSATTGHPSHCGRWWWSKI